MQKIIFRNYNSHLFITTNFELRRKFLTIMIHSYQYVSAEEALAVVQSGHRIYIHGSACTPLFMFRKLAEQSDRLKDVELVFITVQGDIEVNKPKYKDSFHINCMFVSESVRVAVNEGRADFIPVFLSEIPHGKDERDTSLREQWLRRSR